MVRTLLSLVVLAVASTAFGGVAIYSNQTDFDNARAAAGCNVLVGIETFEELGIPPFSLVCYPFPPGLKPPTLAQPMDMYSNYMDPSCDLVGLGAGFVGNATTVVGPNYFNANLNADFAPYGGYCAVGFEVMEPFSGPMSDIQVYDLANVLIGTFTVRFGFTETFYGIVATAPDTIGRIVTVSPSGGVGGAELTDNWQLYVPEPSALSLLALGGLVLLRRR